MKRPSIQPYLWMLFGSMAFAVMASLAHALKDHSPWQIVALSRSSLALTFATGIALATGVRLVLFRPGILWMRSLAGSTSLLCTFFALTRMPAADVLTLGSTMPIWVALLSWPMEGRPPSVSVWIAAVCSLIGVGFIQGAQFQETGFNAGIALVAAFFSAVAMLGLHRLRDVDHLAVVVHFSGVASLVCLGAICFSPADTMRFPSTPLALWMLLGVGISATVGQVFLTKAFAVGPPAKVSIVGLSQIVFTLLLDVFLWGHPVTMLKLAGIALVAGPTAWLMASSAVESEI